MTRIKRAIFKENEEKPGYVKMVRYCTYKEVADDFFSVLDESASISYPDISLKGLSEYCNIDMNMEKSADFKKPIPPGVELKALCTSGNSEGHRVDLMAFIHDETSNKITATYIASVKYFGGDDDAWEAAKVTEKALWNGLDITID